MRAIDLLFLVLSNLGRRKGRVALTAIGVVIGTAAIVVLVSLAAGLQKNATSNLYGIGDLTQISVSPKYDYSAVEGGSGPVPGPGGMPTPVNLITDAVLEEFAALPHVVTVIPQEWFQGGSGLIYGRLEGWGSLVGVDTSDLSVLGLQAQQGRLTLERGEVVVGASIPKNFYDPRVYSPEPPPPQELLDQSLTLNLMKWDQEGNTINKKVRINVVGVLPEMRAAPDYNIYISMADMNAMNEWFLGKRINRDRDGYNNVVVKVDDVKNTLDTTDTIVGMGYEAYTDQQYVEGLNSFYLILQVTFGGVGGIALLVAAIGIANTMAMAILERTREIGLMKAVGATNRDVLTVFLGEAAGIGFIGGIGGVILGWSAGQVINVLALVYMAGQSVQQGYPATSIAVITPPWLLGFALLFAVVIGLLSGIYPALQAATLVPVLALKYE